MWESVVGIYSYYNRSLPYSVKDSELFTKKVLENWFIKNEQNYDNVEEICQYISDCFNVVFDPKEKKFILKPKDGKFDWITWRGMTIGANPKVMLVDLLKELKTFYNMLT